MLKTDYLVIGSGAVGMAFVDTLLTETDAHITIMDRYAKPGGHWNVAYPFVNLHQPSHFYGVSSKELSKGHIYEMGLNKGLYELASGAEVLAYFDEVMRHTFLNTGRVQYFPLCNYKGNYEFESLLTGEQYKVEVTKKIVDSTYFKTSVPATHTPNFDIAKGVHFIPINDLPKVQTPPEGFVVIGGGKTGIDACLWLLENRVNPDTITWIVSRDAWLINRKNTQPDAAFFDNSIGSVANQMEAIATAESIEDLFDKLEAAGVFLRIDKNVRPQMFHGATISELELIELQKIKNIVRLGHVKRIEKNKIVLEKGSIETTPNHIHIDCSASAVTNLEPTTIFEDKLITPQTVRPYQPVFSASLIAYVEAHYEDNKTKNKICQVVPLPNHHTDWIPMMSAQMVNQFTWSKEKLLRNWILENRLDGFTKIVRSVDKSDESKMAILKKLRDNSLPAMMKLQQFSTILTKKQDMQNPQLQVQRSTFFNNKLVEIPSSELKLETGEVLVKIEKFAYTANNITYAVAGDMIGYWQFFPPFGENADGWGVIPVWGFAEIVASEVKGLPIGDRLFGYFPPASHLKMKPIAINEQRFIDGAAHRSQLPAGYNMYRRVQGEPNYNPKFDRERMLLFPLHLTAFCIWDSLQDKGWYGAKQVIILSASSKTSTGLGYALKGDEHAPPTVGITSQRNLEMVEGLDLYNNCITYEQLDKIDTSLPTVIVDMSGNGKVVAALHTALGNNMKWNVNVGLTHWTDAKPQQGFIKDRSEFFFAPGHIQKRIKEWGADGFDKKSASFMMDTAAKTKKWLKFQKVAGLSELAELHPSVCEGKIAPEVGLIVEMD